MSDSTTSTIVIPLTKGQVGVIDSIDADLTEYKWYATKDKYSGFYVVKWNPEGKSLIRMHRVILERILGRALLKGELCDHRDGDGLNNCRSNLRLATNAQNQMNKGKLKNNTSGYKGVSWHKAKRKWRAIISYGGKNIELGYFHDITDAVEAYKQASLKYHGEFSRID